MTGVINDVPVAIGEPPVAAVYQEMVAPGWGGVADKETVPASQRVTLATTELDVVVILAGIAVTIVAITVLRVERQVPTSVTAPAK